MGGRHLTKAVAFFALSHRANPRLEPRLVDCNTWQP